MAYSMLKTVSTGNGGGLGGSSGVGQLAGNVATRLPPTNPLRVNTPLNRTSLSTMTVPKSATLYPSDDVFIELLRSTDFDVQLSAISRLLSLSRKDDNWFRNFTKKADLFQCFDQILRDSKWEVQHQCIKLLADTMHQYGPDLEWCMTSLLPAAVLRLGSGKITIRRVTVQALVSFLRLKPEAVHTFQKAVVNQALTQTDPNALKEVLRELPSVFISELVTKNWAVLVDGLTNLLLTADEETASLILAALEKLLGFVGQQEFNGLIHSIPEKQRTNYEVMLMQRGSAKGRSMAAAPKGPPAIIDASGDKRYRFGIVPVHIFEQLNNDAEPKVRIHGLEQLKAIMERLTDEERARLIPHLHAYLVTMGNVLDDLNFKVVVLALDLLRLTVSKLTTQIDAHLQHVVSIMGKHFGNQKAVIKQLIMMTSIDLMQHLQPKPVIAVLCIYFQHRNSRVREEVINIITAALMKFPSNMFNLTAIAHVLAPLLTDPKRRVRLAAFEQLSVLAQTMGSGKQEPLFKCVRDVEHRQRAPGLMIAVQARLARHQLPRIRYDGLIEYSVPPAPMDNPTRPPGHQQSPDAADFEWIMSAQMGPGSAYSRSLSPTLAQRAAEQKQAGPQSQNTPTMVQSLQPKKPANAPNTSTSITNTITTVTSKANGSTQAPATVPASTTVNNTKSGSNSAPTTKSHGSVFPAQQETKATVAVAEDKKLPWELENTVTPVKKFQDEAKVVSAVKNAAKVMQRRKSDDQSSAVAKKKSTDDDGERL
uniref:TOG domain-containing protein n=1 Tax=Plectus sambesii TaxID=2011161 RepID=A0A914WIF0_9BILA